MPFCSKCLSQICPMPARNNCTSSWCKCSWQGSPARLSRIKVWLPVPMPVAIWGLHRGTSTTHSMTRQSLIFRIKTNLTQIICLTNKTREICNYFRICYKCRKVAPSQISTKTQGTAITPSKSQECLSNKKMIMRLAKSWIKNKK